MYHPVNCKVLGGVEYELVVPRPRWETTPKVVKNNHANILWDIQIHTGKLLMADQLDLVVVYMQKKEAVVKDIAVPCESTIRKKQNENLEKQQGLKEELKKMWKAQLIVNLVVSRTLRAVTPKLEEWLQQRLNIRDLSPKERSSRNSNITVQDPQACVCVCVCPSSLC